MFKRERKNESSVLSYEDNLMKSRQTIAECMLALFLSSFKAERSLHLSDNTAVYSEPTVQIIAATRDV